jgi:DNA-binding transcriptional ArsR family regulator
LQIAVSTTSPARPLFAAVAAVARALGHEHRLLILERLAQGERPVEAIAARCGLTIANASQHLQVLRRAGLVTARRQGKHVHYGLSDDIAVVRLLTSLRELAEAQLDEIERIAATYLDHLDKVEPVSREEMMARIREGTAIALDVRPADEFASAHLPGSRNVPLAELEARLAELPPGIEVVAYCRGPWCVLSFEAVALLRRNGRTARRLVDGLPEWRAAGFPVERA